MVDHALDLEDMDLHNNITAHHDHPRIKIDIQQVLAKRQVILMMHIADPTATTTAGIIDQVVFVSIVPRYSSHHII